MKKIHTFLTTYEVIDGYIKNETGKTPAEIKEAFLKALPEEVADEMDYVTSSEKTERFPVNSRVLVYTVPGGSEGFYLHMDALDLRTGIRQNILLAKTLEGKPVKIKQAEQILWNLVYEY